MLAPIIITDMTAPISSGIQWDEAVSMVLQSARILVVRSVRFFLAKYERGSFLCGIHEKENGQWERVYGTIRPVGVTIKKEFLKTRDEALKNLSISK